MTALDAPEFLPVPSAGQDASNLVMVHKYKPRCTPHELESAVAENASQTKQAIDRARDNIETARQTMTTARQMINEVREARARRKESPEGKRQLLF